MASEFEPILSSLPEAQRGFWPELSQVPRHFVLYGGTALAPRLGHRQSVDFDLFSSQPFTVDVLEAGVPFIRGAEYLDAKPNTLTAVVRTQVKVSFFGGLRLKRVGLPESTKDHVLRVASLLDLAATKMGVVQQRAEKKDYEDVACLLRNGIALTQAIGAARAVYGDQFNPVLTLKALSYFRDGDLPTLPEVTQRYLAQEASRVKMIPEILVAAETIE